jgi:hypothetical protein
MNPYCVYNGLDEQFRPWGGGDPVPPPYPSRVRYFIYGCAIAAGEEAAKSGVG